TIEVKMEKQNKLEPILIWGYNKILKDKGYRWKQINDIFERIESGELPEDYVWSCPRL
ncbi:hypothetical protein LCGC14_2162380, partial [marine sediment metagenome]